MKYFLALFALISLACCTPNIDKLIDESQIERDILVLASDSLMGRAPLTIGETRTISYLEKRMKEIGLEPAFSGSYFQQVPLVKITSKVPDKLVVQTANGKTEVLNRSEISCWSPNLKEEVSLTNSELVFVGFGINAPEHNWNDYEGLDITGKTVVVLVNDPGFYGDDESFFEGKKMTYYGRWPYKFAEANAQGAAGCIIVHEEKAAGYPWHIVDKGEANTTFYLNNEALQKQVSKLSAWLTNDAADKLFALSGHSYNELVAMASKPGFEPFSLNATYSTQITNTWVVSNSHNVGGVILGTKRPEEALVYMAHWDHLGVGDPIDGDSIYNGATDNAASVAWALSIAKGFTELKSKPERSLLFLIPTAEEAMLLGAQHYVDNPVFEHSKTVACFNNDVVLFLGRYKDVTITGLGHSELDDFLAEEAEKQGRYTCDDPNPENGMFYRTDQLPFLKAGIPSLFAKGYTHQTELGREATLKILEDYWKNTYHKPSDHYIPEKHNLEGLVEDAQLFFRLGNRLANDTYFPKWSKTSPFYVER
ncbi:MAG: M28 family peptidase [Tenuifilaceae bacterium]|nr:M28 family peptidase [Tenuifilaceae bacterium]